uniref:Uncharacterized protein n=1 Tax=Paramoeba aestuarina TaxID=180227 RepID=A0A7S4KTA8_9EUKA
MYLLLPAADSSNLARVDYSSLSEQSSMVLFIEKIENKQEICGDAENPRDINEWYGIMIDKDTGNVLEITWSWRNLGGKLSMEWLPPAVRKVCIPSNNFIGSADLSALPRSLRELNLSMNWCSGTVDLRTLPEKINIIRLNGNNFRVPLICEAYPKSLSSFLSKKTVSLAPCVSKSCQHVWKF